MLISSQHRHDKIDGTVYEIVLQPPVHETLSRKFRDKSLWLRRRGRYIDKSKRQSNKKRKSDRSANQKFIRIIMKFQSHNSNINITKIIKIRVIHNKNLCKVIDSFSENTMRSFTWKDVMEDIMEKNGILIDINIIRKISKEELCFSFKRRSYRPFT